MGERMARFSLVTLHVNDMEKSLKFYTELLEMPIVRRLPYSGGREIVFLGVEGQPILELIPSDGFTTYAGISIGFEVEDLQAAKQRLAENGYVVAREFSPNPSLTLCFFDGPNGEEVELLKRG